MKPHSRPLQRNVFSAYLYILILVLFTTSVIAQQTTIDSLEHWIKTYPKRDTVYIKNLIELERAYFFKLPEKYGKKAEEIIVLSKKKGYIQGIQQALAIKALSYIQKGNYSLAIQTVNQKMTYDAQAKNNYELANSYSLLGNANAYSMNFDEALINYNKSFKLLDQIIPKTNDVSELITTVLTNIANIYSENGDEDSAIKYYQTALKELNSSKRIINEKYHFQSLGILLNLGNTCYYQKKYIEALENIDKALNIIENQGISMGASYAYITKFAIYIDLKDFKNAEKLEVLLREKQRLHQLTASDLAEFYLKIVALNEAKKNYKKALDVFKELTIHNDSIRGSEEQNKINELSIKYETEQKELKIRQLQKEKTFSQTQRNYLIVVVALLGVLLVVAFVAIIQVRKSKRKVEEADALRNKLLGIVTHDLRSPVASLRQVSSKVSFVLNKNDKTATQLLTSSIEGAANSLYGLIDNLLHWSLLQQGKVQFQPSKFVLSYELSEVLQTLKYRMTDKSIKLTIDIDDTIEVVTDRMICQTIFRNLLDNGIKFTPEGKSIWVSAEKRIDDVTLLVKDEGEGIPKEMQDNLFVNVTNKSVVGTEGEKGKGIGLNLCYELALLAGCRLYIAETSTNGTTMALQIPFKK